MKGVNNHWSIYQNLQSTLPPDDSSEDTSVPDLETHRKQKSPDPEELKEPDNATLMTIPADANADMDHFKDTDRKDILRQQLNKELNEPPWNQDASQQALEQLEKVTKTVQPVHQDFWYKNDSDIAKRLNEAAKKLKDRQAQTNMLTS